MGLFPADRDLNEPPGELELEVTASSLGMRRADVNIRLDSFLGRHLKWRSRTSIQRLVKDGWVLVDASTPDHPAGTGELKKECRPGRRLHHGSRIVIIIPPEQRLPVPEDTGEALEVLHEDRDSLAVDKPAGMPVHPTGRHHSDTLIQRVHVCYRESHLEHGVAPRLCHRIDLETSGIVLIAKNPQAHRKLAAQFENRRVEKEYLAIVRGRPGGSAGEIDYPMRPSHSSDIRLKMTVAADGLPCRTEWRLLRCHGDVSLLSCSIHTGRQHQIRVHLSAIGHPIVGDKLYGRDDAYFKKHADGLLTAEDLHALELPHHALHSHRLVFTSSVTGDTVEVVSPLPADLREYLSGRELLDV